MKPIGTGGIVAPALSVECSSSVFNAGQWYRYAWRPGPSPRVCQPLQKPAGSSSCPIPQTPTVFSLIQRRGHQTRHSIKQIHTELKTANQRPTRWRRRSYAQTLLGETHETLSVRCPPSSKLSENNYLSATDRTLEVGKGGLGDKNMRSSSPGGWTRKCVIAQYRRQREDKGK